MDWDLIAPMVVSIVFFLTVGGVILLRPIAKRIGDLLEVYAREREGGLEVEVRQMREILETMNSRLQLMEERQDFTERLLTSGEGKSAAAPLKQITPNG